MGPIKMVDEGLRVYCVLSVEFTREIIDVSDAPVFRDE